MAAHSSIGRSLAGSAGRATVLALLGLGFAALPPIGWLGAEQDGAHDIPVLEATEFGNHRAILAQLARRPIAQLDAPVHTSLEAWDAVRNVAETREQATLTVVGLLNEWLLVAAQADQADPSARAFLLYGYAIKQGGREVHRFSF